MIHIVTASPCFDFYFDINNLDDKEVSSYSFSKEEIGGKGFKVSKRLEDFNIKHINYTFLGEDNYSNFLSKYKKSHKATLEYILYQGEVRRNLKAIKLNNESSFSVVKEINKISNKISDENIKALIDKISKNLVSNEQNYILLCGSSNPNYLYKKLIESSELQKALFLIDTSKSSLAEIIKSIKRDNILLIKPNLDELCDVLDLKIEEAKISNSNYICDLLNKKVLPIFNNKLIYITNNIYDSYYFNNEAKKFEIIKNKTILQTKLSTVGAGDRSFAYFLTCYINNLGFTVSVNKALKAVTIELETGKLLTKEELFNV